MKSPTPTVDSLIVNLKASGAEALIIAATPRFAAQALRKLNDIGRKPLTIVNAVSSSVSATLQPVGLDKVVGGLRGVLQGSERLQMG
jgi:branched-chain amino acid transport system substrate-binding protein